MLSALGHRELPIPEHIDIFHLKREQPASQKTALECVMEVDEIRLRLEHEAEELATRADDESKLHVVFASSCMAAAACSIFLGSHPRTANGHL